jgi:glycosyltransferase involved in cell wall biosynthesis
MKPLRILQVSARDVAGGAERSARNLADEFRRMGHESWLAVGERHEDDPYTFRIPNDEHRNALVRAIDHLRRDPEAMVHRIRGMGRLTSLARQAAEPSRTLALELGHEDFDFPATGQLLDLTPAPPDILHLHNLHGDYFDLRALPRLTSRVPTILNIRDGWLMSGHCAFSLDCERWKTGCGHCPDLTLYPAVKRDATSFNWQRKRALFAGSRYSVATASEWMMARVRESIVAAGAIDTRVIPNGVDTSIFRPRGRAASRATLGIDPNARVMLVAANGLRSNVWKDYRTLRAALEIVGAQPSPARTIVLALGEVAETESIGGIELRFVPFQTNSERLAEYYSAADVYLHAARVESFGNVLLEARACGTPIVANAIGGIPEQVRALAGPWLPSGIMPHEAGSATGILVPSLDPAAFAAAIQTVLGSDELRATLTANGLHHVQHDFTLQRQAERFVAWYREILAENLRPEVHHASV